MSEAEAEALLFDSAKETLTRLVQHKIGSCANRQLVAAINTRIDPDAPDIASEMAKVVEASANRISKLTSNQLSKRQFELLIDRYTVEFETALADGTWKAKFRGRDILKRLVTKHTSGISYLRFRNLIVARMRDQFFQPAGMKRILEQIAS
jgi:hypothetical protein